MSLTSNEVLDALHEECFCARTESSQTTLNELLSSLGGGPQSALEHTAAADEVSATEHISPIAPQLVGATEPMHVEPLARRDVVGLAHTGVLAMLDSLHPAPTRYAANRPAAELKAWAV